MNIFNVLRYPINENFTIEDLERLPRPLIAEWWDTVVRPNEHKRFYRLLSGDTISLNQIHNYMTKHSQKFTTEYYLKELQDRINNIE